MQQVMWHGKPLPMFAAWPVGELTQAQKQTVRISSATDLLDRAENKRIINEANAFVRMIRPFTDLLTIGAATALSGAVAYNQWLSAAYAAGVNDVYVNSQLAVNRMLSFFGFSVAEPANAISEILFERGAAGLGGVNGIANVQGGYAHLETEWYLSKGIMYDPQEIVYVVVTPNLAVAGGQHLVLEGWVAEPVGITISAPPL